MSRLRDAFGRAIDEIRISLTDRCNFRCVYCMPTGGLPGLPRGEILTFEEILRLARMFIGLGIRTIRLTGGEPLLRQDIADLVAGVARLKPDLDLSLTTNGALLGVKAFGLAQAGLKRVNVSLDTLQPVRFQRLTRCDGRFLSRVLEGLAAARAVGLRPTKVNCVLIRGCNDDEAVDFARFGREHDYQVRFIEYMPLDAQGDWRMSAVVPAAEILARIERVFPLAESLNNGGGPARVYRFTDGRGSIGVIPSVTRPFCSTCNRIRLTSDGRLRTCVFSNREYNLKRLLRSGASDDQLIDTVVAAVRGKEAGHKVNQPGFIRPTVSMSTLGG